MYGLENDKRDFPPSRFIAIFLVIYIYFPGFPLYSLDPDKPLDHYIVDQWQTADNLPSNRINNLIQSSEGYLWLATGNGLVRFDGIRFTVYSKKQFPGLGSDYIHHIVQEKDGGLLISSHKGLCFYQRGKFEHASGDASTLPIWVTLKDKDGSLWIGTDGSGLVHLKDGSAIYYKKKDGLTGNFIRSICRDREDNLWIGTRKGLNRLKDGNLTGYTVKDGLPNNFIKMVYPDSKGNLWIGTYGGGLCRWNDGKFEVYSTDQGLPGNAIRVIYEDSRGILWIGSRNGLTRRKEGVFSTTLLDDSSPYTLVSRICEDNEGNLWVATHSKGLFRLRNRFIESFTAKDGLSDSAVLCFCYDSRKTLWVGMRDGLYFYDQGGFKRLEPPGVSVQYGINSIVEDRKGVLWIGTESDGLYRMKPDTKHFSRVEQLLSKSVRSLYVLRDGRVGVGSYDSGLFIIGHKEVEHYSVKDGIAGHLIRYLLDDDRGNLWIATDRGLNRLYDGKISTYTTRHGLRGNTISSLYLEEDGTLWIGTYEDGISRFKNGRFTSCSSKDGLYDDGIYEILQDVENNFWIASKTGIYSVSWKELNDFLDGKTGGFTTRAYDEGDGMASSQCKGDGGQGAAVKTPDGKLWFATTRGIAMLDPKELKTNHIPPPVKIETMLVDNLPIDLTIQNSLAPGIKNIELNYTALSLTSPEKIRFRYRLTGFDEDWKNVGGRRFAHYTNLQPGSYRFEVIACNNEGIWNLEGDAFQFYLRSYFYRTWWFYMVAGILILGLITSFFYFRERRIKLNEARLAGLVEERTAQLQTSNIELREQREAAEKANRAKTEFLARMSHEIRTPLNGVIGFTDILLASGLKEKQLDYARTIHRSGEALLDLVNEVLDFSKIEAGELSFDACDFAPHLTAFDVCDMVRPRLENKSVTIGCHINDNMPAFVVGDPARFRQVLLNLAGNAAKFTKKGEIVVTMKVEETESGTRRIKLHVSVRDTGIGIARDKIDVIFNAFQQADGSTTRKYGGTGLGLAISKRIVKMMGGDLWVESEVGKGSTFHFTAWMETSDQKAVSKIPREFHAHKSADSGTRKIANKTGRTAHILLAEDNPVNRKLAKFLLTRAGYRMTIVDNGLEAVETYSALAENFDLILMDVHMPKLNGLEATQRIRELEGEDRHIPIIAMTADSMKGDREKCLQAGMDDYIAKPIRREIVFQMIEKWVLLK